VSKASKKLRLSAVGARKSRATELSILAIGASLLAPYAIAQEQDAAATNTAEAKSESDLTEILVTGIRKALATSQEIKKESDTVVDSITASDIGAFPDKSVAEALQRVTGVTVTRFAASGDTTHFSAEPSGVIIRGLPQVRSEFNGRDSFNANSSRGLSFGDVSPELMAGVDTYKNSTAEMIEGGIAGTVNLRTHVPFDSQGFVLAASADLGYGDLSEEANPSGSLIISDRWDTGVGEFGLMANAAYSEVTTESQGTQIGRFYNIQGVEDYGGGQKWIPGGVDIRDNVYDRTRTGLSFSAQYQSPNDKLLATLQYNRSEYENNWTEYSLSAVIGNSQTAQDLVSTNQLAFAPTGTRPYTFDSRGVFTSGVIAESTRNWGGPASNNLLLTHPNGFLSSTGHALPEGLPDIPANWVPSVPGQPMDTPFLNWACPTTWDNATAGPYCAFSETRGVGLGADSRYSTQTNITSDVSLNLRWEATENLGLNFDVQYIDSSVVNFDNSMNAKTFADLDLDLTGGKPKFALTPAQGFGFTSGAFSDPQNYYHEWSMEHAEDSSGDELAMRLDADFDLGDEGWLDALRVGVRRAERDQDVNWSRYNWGGITPLWGLPANTPVFLNDPRWAGTYQNVDLGSDLVGGGVFAGGTFLHPNIDLVKDYQATIDTMSGPGFNYVPLGSRTNCVLDGLYCPVEQQHVSEDVDAAYIMLKFGNDDTNWGSVNVRGNIGVRYVRTTVEAAGGIQYPNFTPPSAGSCVPSTTGVISALCLTPADDILFMDAATSEQTGGAEHTNWLPSLNLRFGLTDKTFFRFALSRAMARPDMGLYKNYVGVSLVQPGCDNGTTVYAVPGDCTSSPISYTPAYTADAGNPQLGPTTADQIDLTYEWYFSNTGSLTAALFYKGFNDYIQYGSYIRPFTNNGVTRDVSIRGSISGDGASLRGFEVQYQSFLDMLPAPWSGFGYQLNYTYVDNQGITNSNLSTVSNDGTTRQDPLITFQNLPLEGYSQSTYNIVAMFEQEKFSARLAYNWRSEYLISQSDCCIKLPIWQDAYGQLDGSFHYKPSANWDVFLDAQNLLQSETVLRQQVTNSGMTLPRSWFVNDRRFQIGVRYRFQ
jgi:iron complex outermembrane recepter protein